MLRGDVAGLQYALMCAAQRRITVAAIHEASFAQGLAAARPQTRPVPAAPLRLLALEEIENILNGDGR